MIKDAKILPVPYRVWLKWMEYKEYGDTRMIAQSTGYSTPTIRKALNQKTAQSKVQLAITAFYAEKANQKVVMYKQSEQEQLEKLSTI